MPITAFCSHNLQLEWKEADQFPTDLKLKASDKENQMNSGNTQSWSLTAVILWDSPQLHYSIILTGNSWPAWSCLFLSPFQLLRLNLLCEEAIEWGSDRIRLPLALLLLWCTHFGSPNLFGYGSGNERIDLNEEKTEIQRLRVAKGQGKLFIEPSEQTPAWLFESRWGDTSEDSRAKGAWSSDWAC